MKEVAKVFALAFGHLFTPYLYTHAGVCVFPPQSLGMRSTGEGWTHVCNVLRCNQYDLFKLAQLVPCTRRFVCVWGGVGRVWGEEEGGRKTRLKAQQHTMQEDLIKNS